MPRPIHMLSLATTCVMASLMIGCEAAQPTGQPASRPDSGNERIAALDGLEDQTKVGSPRVEGGEQEPLRVEVPIRATTPYDLTVQYRFEFVNDAGLAVEPAMGWRYMYMPSNIERLLSATAPDESAADWRLEVHPSE